MLTWEKKLSTTDAQQQTTGGLVPYLRLTSGSLTNKNFQTWFRQDFFKNCSWKASHFNKKPVEEADVQFHVTVQGSSLGSVLFTVTHDDTRENSHNAPNTWLHWPSQMASVLQQHNYAGKKVVLTNNNGTFSLEIK